MAKRPSLTAAAKPQITPGALALLQVEDWESTGELQLLAITVIDPSPYQPRESYDDDTIESLAASIQTMGVIQPIIVRPKDNERYELMAGHRRWLAAQRAGRTTIPAVVRSLDSQSAAALSLIENLQREDLNPMDIAQGLQRMVDEFKVAQIDLAKLLGRSKADITLTLGLLKLHPDIQLYIRQGKLTAGHGRLLYRLPVSTQWRLAQAAITREWTVRELEAAIRREKVDAVHPSPKDPDIERLENLLTEHFAISTWIRPRKNGSGTITFHYHSLDECEALLERFGLKPEQYR